MSGTLANILRRQSHFVNNNLVWLLIASYALAAVFPTLGLKIRQASFGEAHILQEEISFSVPVLMLALLLFNAGLGVQTTQLTRLMNRKAVLLIGFAANFVIPVTFIGMLSQVIRMWPDGGEAQSLLVGLALVAAMPIAGSSTAWSQLVNGDLALSVGLVLLTTFLSPVITPAILQVVGLLSTDEYAHALKELASRGTGAFLWIGVVIPCALGVVTRQVVRASRVALYVRHIKLLNAVIILLLNYSNASLSLPQIMANPDPAFLLITVILVAALCITAFGSAFYLSRLLDVDHAQEASLVYGLGMNNNGTGLVLASLALAAFPRIMLPIIFYNLMQHLVAAAVQFLRYRTTLHASEP
jgi:BASS family bile acid:Na+ symporter